jgi:tetratricopeptide (TPR) repeat protein
LLLYRRVGDVIGEASCISGLGSIAQTRSEYEEARQQLEVALPLYQRMGSVVGEANCISGLGSIAQARSEYEEARQQLEVALPLHQRMGSVIGEANCIVHLGQIAQAQSEYEEARQQYEAALSLYQRVGDVTGEALCLHGKGRIYLEQQPADYDRAESYFQDALKLAHRDGHRWNVAYFTISLGELAIATGDNEKARQLLEESLATFRSFPTPEWIGKAHKQLARLETGEQKLAHLCVARRAWQKVGLNNLIAELETEYSEIDFSQCPAVGEDEY